MKLRLLRPVPSFFKISSPFGPRKIEGKLKVHNGIDFACPIGTQIKAVEDGIAERVGWENELDRLQGFGLRIMQRLTVDGIMYFAFYGHCDVLLVKEGERIKKGQVIAESGNTGHTTGPHLHFGIRKADTGIFCDVEFYESPENIA